MKIAVPTSNGLLCPHFGGCSEFTIFDVDDESREIRESATKPAPDHQPGAFPKFMLDNNINVLIAGGIGGRAVQILAAKNVEVVTGAPEEPPEKVVGEYLQGNLQTTAEVCDHSEHGHGPGHGHGHGCGSKQN